MHGPGRVSGLTFSCHLWTWCPSTSRLLPLDLETFFPWTSLSCPSNLWTLSPWTWCPFSYRQQKPLALRTQWPARPRLRMPGTCFFSSGGPPKDLSCSSSATTGFEHVLISFPLLQAGVRLTVL